MDEQLLFGGGAKIGANILEFPGLVAKCKRYIVQ